MARGHHGDKSKYFHIRLRDPKKLKNMRTVDRGPVKQVVGKDKKGRWVNQNIMVKKSHAKASGSRLIIKDKKVRGFMRENRHSLINIFRRKDAGSADYHIKKKKKK